ncbi:MAG: peptidoglycan-binding protein [Deltaproteobacteria bacterium]|nr:peptidoglycan-binding protein [Deltaproteobacteria bacterium]
MTSISRTDFTRRLSDRGGYLNIDRLTPQVRTSLRDAGVTDQDLRDIAGHDHVIRGEEEWNNLFRRLDRADHDGSSRSIALTDRAGSPTVAGRAFSALERTVTENRDRVAREGGRRFAGVPELDRTAQGRTVLNRGDTGEGVRRVQQALIDLGYANTANMTMGTYDAETTRAVRRFQRDAGVGIDGQVGRDTLAALAASAPPPGQALERRAEFDRLRADGRVDVTVALGFDEHGTGAHLDGEREVLSGLRSRGFRAVTNQQIRAMDPADRRRLGLNDDRLDPNARYFIQDDGRGGQVDTVVRLIVPGSDGATARASFERAMQQDEVVIYSGHARYGTGPDFDHIDSGRGNFVIDGHGNRAHEQPPTGLRRAIGGERRSDLRGLSQRPDYQLLVFNACSTEEYLNNLRNPGVFGRDMANTDIITTTMPTRLATNGRHVLGFLDGVMQQQSNNQMLGAQNRLEQDQLRRFGMDELVNDAAMTYSESGFLGNQGNRRVPSSSGARP